MKPSTVTFDDRLCLSVAETAAVIGVSKPTVWDEIKKGRLRVAKVGRRTLVPVDAIQAWLASMMRS